MSFRRSRITHGRVYCEYLYIYIIIISNSIWNINKIWPRRLRQCRAWSVYAYIYIHSDIPAGLYTNTTHCIYYKRACVYIYNGELQCMCVYASVYLYIPIYILYTRWTNEVRKSPRNRYYYFCTNCWRSGVLAPRQEGCRSGVCAWHFINSGARQSVRVTGRRVYVYARVYTWYRGRENAYVCMCMAKMGGGERIKGRWNTKKNICIYTLRRAYSVAQYV